MSSPYQAILWGRVLPLETFDEARILAFWQQWGGRTNPEKHLPDARTRARQPTVSSAPSTEPSSVGSPDRGPDGGSDGQPERRPPRPSPSAAAPSPS